MVKISVTVDQAHLPAIGSVARDLQARGMQVEQVLGIGVITGSVPADSRPGLESVDGVQSVDEQLDYQLPDPGNELQ